MPFIQDGFYTWITFSLGAVDTLLRERSVQPPGMDGGAPVDTTTMRNNDWRTANPRFLKGLDTFSATCSYDPVAYGSFLDMINVNQQITVTFPSPDGGVTPGKTLIFWGFLKSFKPAALQEGTFPLATVEVTPTNHDNSNNEASPTGTAMA